VAAYYLRDGAELLTDAPMARRGKQIIAAMYDAAPIHRVATSEYQGEHRILMTYGVGLPARTGYVRSHVTRGGLVFAWDLGYFDRANDAMRLSMNDWHPTIAQIEATPAVGRRTIQLRDDYAADGPILLAGMGDKSAVMCGLLPMQWETAARDRIRAEFPGREIRWRPKGRNVRELAKTRMFAGGTIEDALRGCSLVVCRHSNVAVDACIAGIPTRCHGGAADWLYKDGPAPSAERRQQFVNKLTWWNWLPSEAKETWKWILSLTAR
jgi:hypothetical protein